MQPTTDARSSSVALPADGGSRPFRPARLLGLATRGPTAIMVAFAGPLGAAAIMAVFRTHIANTSLALIMVAVVVVTVAPGRRLSALVAGASAGLWFDFFLTRPYESFTITRGADRETTLLLVAVAVGEIAARNQGNRTRSARTGSDLASVRSVAHLLATGASGTALTAAVAAELKELLALDSVRFEETRDIPMPYQERSGAVRYSNYFSWDHTREGLPAKVVILPVESDGRPVGRFALVGPPFGIPLSTDRLLTAVALADLTAASITRSGTTERHA